MAVKTKGAAAINQAPVPLLFPSEGLESDTSSEGCFSLFRIYKLLSPGDVEHELSAFLQDSCRAGMLLKALLHSKLPGVSAHVGFAFAKQVCFHVLVAEMYQECPIIYYFQYLAAYYCL